MFAAYLVITASTIVVNAGAAVTDLLRARFALATSAEVGVPRSWLPLLGSLKAAGAVGLLLGLLGVPFIGIAAATGLVGYFLGAVIAHLRANVYHNIAFPGTYLALSVATLALTVVR